jgi:hypothetical protein
MLATELSGAGSEDEDDDDDGEEEGVCLHTTHGDKMAGWPI